MEKRPSYDPQRFPRSVGMNLNEDEQSPYRTVLNEISFTRRADPRVPLAQAERVRSAEAQAWQQAEVALDSAKAGDVDRKRGI